MLTQCLTGDRGTGNVCDFQNKLSWSSTSRQSFTTSEVLCKYYSWKIFWSWREGEDISIISTIGLCTMTLSCKKTPNFRNQEPRQCIVPVGVWLCFLHYRVIIGGTRWYYTTNVNKRSRTRFVSLPFPLIFYMYDHGNRRKRILMITWCSQTKEVRSKS